MLLAHELIGSSHQPSLVLIHGITENHHMWHPLVPHLTKTHQVLLVDLRGHGASDASDPYDPLTYATDVVETATALGVRDPLVIGHSLGGVVATAYPLVGPCVGVINVDQPLQLAAFQAGLQQLQPMLEGHHKDFVAAIDMVFESMNGALPADEVTRIRALRGNPDQHVVLGTWHSVLHSTPEELDATVDALAGGVTVPYLSLHGIDPGPDYASWLTARIPQAQVEVWAGLGHYPQLVEPKKFLERVAEFEAQVRG